MTVTKLSRGVLPAIASIWGAFTFLHASTVPSSGSTAFTTPAFIGALPITPTESHGVTLAFGTGDYLYVLLSDGAQVEKFDVNLVQQPFTGTGNGGGAGSGANQFGASTTGITVYRGGPGNTDPTYDKIIAADRVNNRIKILDQYGNLLFQFGTNGTGKGQFDGTITSVDVDQSTGEIYVLDGLGYARVQKFDSSGNFERMWGWGVKTGAATFEICISTDPICLPGLTGSGPGQFGLYQSTGGIATDGTNVYVSDQSNFRIEKFDSSGNYLGMWGSAGTGDGQCAALYGCVGIRYSNGLLYVADSYPNNRIQLFDTNGVFQGAWGDSTVFFQPEDIAIASTGVEVVSDYYPGGFGRLSKWSAAVSPHPINKDQCKDGGYVNYVDANNLPFKNQGQCVSYVNHL